MREPKGLLHKPLTALGRIQILVERAAAVARNDRNPNQQAIVQSILREARELAYAARNGGPLPLEIDHDRKI